MPCRGVRVGFDRLLFARVAGPVRSFRTEGHPSTAGCRARGSGSGPKNCLRREAETLHPDTAHEPGPARSPSLAKGLGWTTFGQLAAQALNFLTLVLLPLYVDPHDFGVFAIAMVVIGLMDALVDFGTGTVLVQRATLTQGLIDTAFSTNLVLALVAAAILVGLGLIARGVVAEDFDGPAVATVFFQLAPLLPFTPIANVQRSLLQRRLWLHKVAQVTLAVAVIRAVVAIGLAALGFGVLALVLGFYASSILAILWFWSLTVQPVRLRFDPAERRALFAFGWRLTSFNLLSQALTRIDAFVLTVAIGTHGFGLFALARQVVLQPVEIAGNIVRSVLMPKLARLQGSTARSRFYYLRSSQLLCGSLCLVLVPIALLFDLVATAWMKSTWAGVGCIAAALLPAALAMLLLQTCGSMLVANGQAGALLRWGVLRGVVVLAACCAAFWFGPVGVAVALGVLLLVAMPGFLLGAARLLRLPSWDLFLPLAQLLPATAAAAVALLGARSAAQAAGLSPLPALAAAALAALGAYVVVAWATRVPAVTQAQRWWRRRARRRTGTAAVAGSGS